MINWNSLLEDMVPRPCHDRPFVCEGFPSDSNLIVIGENPATPMTEDWWNYWSPNSGFNYEKFVADYRNQRAALGKKISNTRRRLNRIRENGLRCVETNAFRNERLDGKGDGTLNYDMLNVLIEHMPKLTAVLAHGRIASDYLSLAKIPDGVHQYETRHFRMERYSRIDDICAEILSRG